MYITKKNILKLTPHFLKSVYNKYVMEYNKNMSGEVVATNPNNSNIATNAKSSLENDIRDINYILNAMIYNKYLIAKGGNYKGHIKYLKQIQTNDIKDLKEFINNFIREIKGGNNEQTLDNLK
jgi:hypothetical protein